MGSKIKQKYYRLIYWYIYTFKVNQDLGKYFELSVKCGYLSSSGEPLICFFCGCKKIKNKVTDTHDGNFTLEMDAICTKCNKIVGAWAYGNWII